MAALLAHRARLLLRPHGRRASLVAAAADPAPMPPASSPPPAPAVSRTIFKRPLLPPAVALASPDGRAKFNSALATGGGDVFFETVSHFNTQDEPAFCGLASLAMALNALAVDPRRPWKGPWRYYSERLLDCCLPLDTVKKNGITLDQAACLARCNGADVTVKRPPAVNDDDDEAAVAASLAAFRADVAASAGGSGGVVIVSYSRAAVNQTGDGHFSVIGAYDGGGGDDDCALILDTARFKYPPHWLPLPTLHAAMRPPDAATGAPRGWMVLSAAPAASVLFSLARGAAPETAAAREWGRGGVERALAAAPADPAQALAAVAAAAPAASVAALVAVRAAALGRGSPPPPPDADPATSCSTTTPCAPTDAAATLLRELRAAPFFAAVEAGLAAAHPDAAACAAHAAAGGDGLLAERVALFLAALPAAAWSARPDVAALLAVHAGSVLEAEVAYVARQAAELPALTAAADAAAAGCGCGKR